MSSVPSKEQIGVLERQRRSASRIRALLFMQMGDKLRKRTRRQRRRFAFLLFLQILAAVAVTAICTVLCNVLANTFHVPMDRDMLAAIFLLTQLISIIANVGTIQDILFTDRENSMLLTFPCTFREIAISKLLLFFMRELKKNCFFLLPFLFGFAIATAQSPAFFLFAIGAYLLLSALPIFVACVLSIAFLYVNRWLQSIPLLYATVLSLFFAGIFYVAYRILLLLPDPLRFLQEYASYIARITDVVDAVARFSLHYGSLADILTGDGRLFDWVLVLVASAVITVAGITLLLPFYFRAVSSSAERSTREKKVRVRRHESSSLTAARGRFGHLALYRTFLHKELIITVRDVQKLSATITSFFVLPLVSYVMNQVLDSINTNPLGDYMVIAFNLMISASLLAAFNTDCACALSMEGLEFGVLKTAPSNTMSIAWAKITVTLLSNLIAILATTGILYFTTGMGVIDLLLFAVTLLFIAGGVVLWSFQLDVCHPLFHEYASKGGGVVDNPNVGKAALYGFLTATISGLLTLLLLHDGYVTGWIRILLLATCFLAARVFLFYRNLQVYFHEIEL
ncbi:MAG: hypothetical protein J6T24_00490 [Clostridia bacterium]|nr:hypothetical protein [Clostridia bacterium]